MVHSDFQNKNFNPEKPFIVLKEMKIDGRSFKSGDPFPHYKWNVNTRRLAQLYDRRMIGHPGDDEIEIVNELLQLEQKQDEKRDLLKDFLLYIGQKVFNKAPEPVNPDPQVSDALTPETQNDAPAEPPVEGENPASADQLLDMLFDESKGEILS